jgi:fructose-specific component phosphotransferase system IIB-like protein
LISVEGHAKYHARPGALKGRKAIRIDERLATASPPAPKTSAVADAAKPTAPAVAAKKK